MKWLALIALGTNLFAAQPVILDPKDFDWKVSGTLPQGLATHDYHLIREDPVTHGIQTFVRFSKGYALPAHQHSHDETIVVIKGKLAVTLNGKARTLAAGSYAVIPAGTPHALATEGWSGCELLVSFAGPVDFKPAAETAKP